MFASKRIATAWLVCAGLAAAAGCDNARVEDAQHKVEQISNRVAGELKQVKNEAVKLIPRPGTDLAVVDYKLARDKAGHRFIAGTLHNKSQREYGKVQVQFNVYDASGALLGNTYAQVASLDRRGTWKFTAPVQLKSGTPATVKLKDVSGY